MNKLLELELGVIISKISEWCFRTSTSWCALLKTIFVEDLLCSCYRAMLPVG